jgi:hypothetical protein
MKYTAYCLLGTAIYYAASAFVAMACVYFEDNYDTNMPSVENLYYRFTYFSEYISINKFLYFWLMNLIGFTFVNIVNL